MVRKTGPGRSTTDKQRVRLERSHEAPPGLLRPTGVQLSTSKAVVAICRVQGVLPALLHAVIFVAVARAFLIQYSLEVSAAFLRQSPPTVVREAHRDCTQLVDVAVPNNQRPFGLSR